VAQRIVIIGGISSQIEREELLRRLAEASGDAVQWDWIKPNTPSFNLPKNPLNRLLSEFRNPKSGSTPPTVVKLSLLHGRDQNTIYQTVGDPVEPPSSISTADELITWILSDEANLVPKTEWHGNVCEAALAAILCKLIGNKSWNKDTQGHAWTRESNLMGQSPVCRPKFGKIQSEARHVLAQGNGSLFLTKGGSQGQTKKEWSINTRFLPLVKQMMLDQSFTAMQDCSELMAIHRRLDQCEDKAYRIDGEIVSERVRRICFDAEH
jgi:hypothetical protein